MKRLNKKEILSIKALRAEGRTNRQIAIRLGVKERAIYYWVARMREEGIEVPTINKRGGVKIKLS